MRPILSETKWVASIVISLLLAACVPPPDFPEEGALRTEYRGLFILNEGQWNQSNATLDFYDPAQGYARVSEVFFRTNGERLGDVANSVLLDADTLYIVMNNTQLIYKVQLPTLQVLGRIALPAAASPRQMVKVSATKAYVNSLLGGTLYVVNPMSLQVTATLPLPDHAEGMVFTAGRVFITLGSYPGTTNNQLAVLDPTTDTVQLLSLPVENPGPLALLPDGQLAIGCRGNYLNTNSAVVWLDPATRTFTDTVYVNGYLYELAALPDRLALTSDFDISAIDYATRSVTYGWVSRATLGARSTDLLYALHWDEVAQALYVTNAGYGAQNGRCYILNGQGQLQQTLSTGIFPGTVFWVR
jgi:DNA-binding beta-propeller fold protein YncE